MPIVINGYKRANQLFAKLSIHETAFFLYCCGRETHEYQILQHIRGGIGIEDNRILADWAINGISNAPGASMKSTPVPLMKLPSASNSRTDGAGAQHLLRGGVNVAQGGVVDFEAPLAYSNVMLVCPSCSRPTRTKHTVLESGARVLVCRHCGEPYERVRKTEAQ